MAPGAGDGLAANCMIIAIDGPAASGKGTLSRRVAAHYGFHHLDTGRLYRAVARDVLARGCSPDDAAAAAAAARRLEALAPDRLDLDDPALSSRAMGEGSSKVARFPAVRAALLAFQRSFARRPPGAVLDGRDVGTVVCPGADVKLFVTAAPEVRARRRFTELRGRGEPADFESVLADLRARDERDRTREIAPLRPAPGALVLDTTDMDADAAFDAALALIGSATDRGRAFA